MQPRRGTWGPERIRLLTVIAASTVLAAAGAAIGSTPVEVASAPAQVVLPGPTAPEPPAPTATTTTTPQPPCVPAASLRERAARVLIVGLPEVTDPSDPLVEEVVQLGVGGVFITGGNVVSREQTTGLIGEIKRRARHPMVISIDEEPGRVTSLGHVIGTTSSARRLARERTPEEIRQLAQGQAAAMASMGITLDLAPVADLDDGPANATIGDRSFSGDPSIAARYAHAYAAGLADQGVGAVAKHFPGRAQAQGDDHVGRITSPATMEQLRANDLQPFADLIARGIPVVMLSNIDYAALDPETPATMSRHAYSLLREMGFKGVAITDSIGMGAVNQRWDWSEASVKAIASGGDGVLTTNGRFARDMVHGLVVAVQNGELSEARLNEAAARMVALAGGDAVTFACRGVELPKLQPPS